MFERILAGQNLIFRRDITQDVGAYSSSITGTGGYKTLLPWSLETEKYEYLKFNT